MKCINVLPTRNIATACNTDCIGQM